MAHLFNRQDRPLYLACGCWVIQTEGTTEMWDKSDRRLTPAQVNEHARLHQADLKKRGLLK